MARLEEEAGCCVLLPQVPTGGALAQRARAILIGSQEQQGTEQTYGVLKDPGIVTRRFLQKPARIAALGLV
jgi:hypothetical protein